MTQSDGRLDGDMQLHMRRRFFVLFFLSPEISFVTSDGDKHVSTSTERRDDANMDQALFRPPPSYRDSIYLHLVEETTGYRGFGGGGGRG